MQQQSPFLAFASGRLAWHFADGTVLPRIAGGADDGMTLEQALAAIEAEGGLDNLSDADVAAARAAIEAEYDALREEIGDGTPTAEQDATINELLDALDAVRANVEGREAAAAERVQRLAEYDARRAGNASEDEADGEGEEDAEGETTETAEGETEGDGEGEREPIAASTRNRFAAARARATRPSRAALNRSQPRSANTPPRPEMGTAVLTASADVPGVRAGGTISTAAQFGQAIESRWRSVRQVSRGRDTTGPEYFRVAEASHGLPGDLVVPEHASPHQVTEIMDRAVARHAETVRSNLAAMRAQPDSVVLASGGPCVVREQIFDVPFVADSSQPFWSGIPKMVYNRGGISFYPPLCYDRNPVHSISGTTTNTSPNVTVTVGTVNQSDVGKVVAGAGVPVGTRVLSVTDSTHFVMNANATASATVALTLTGRSGNVGRVITRTQDAANYISQGGTTPDKACDTVTCPSPTTCDSSLILFCLRIGNWVDRTFPEWVRAWRESVDVGFANTWEEAAMAQVIAGSVLMAGAAPKLGAWGDFLTQLVVMVERIISARRLPENTMFRYWCPAWAIDALKLDLAMGIGGRDAGNGYANFRVTDADLVGWLAERQILLSTYIDEAGPTAQGANQVLSLPTTGTIPGFPATMRGILYREGAWVGGTGGELAIGLWRDSQLIGTNDYGVFQENEFGLCYKGCNGESYVLDHQLIYDGLTTGLVNPRL